MSSKFIERARIAFGVDPRPRNQALKTWEAKWGASPGGQWVKGSAIKAAPGRPVRSAAKPAATKATPPARQFVQSRPDGDASDFWEAERERRAGLELRAQAWLERNG